MNLLSFFHASQEQTCTKNYCMMVFNKTIDTFNPRLQEYENLISISLTVASLAIRNLASFEPNLMFKEVERLGTI